MGRSLGSSCSGAGIGPYAPGTMLGVPWAVGTTARAATPLGLGIHSNKINLLVV